jgi:hypothetical protein
MKRALSLFLLALLASGCQSHYQITLNNSHRITTRDKPKLVDGCYVFKDLNGQTNYVSATRVRAIEPQPRGESEEALFNPSRQR